MLASKIQRVLASVAFVTCVLTAVPSFAQAPQVPQTAAEHESRAKTYSDQAAQYRKAAEEHKAMAAEYAKKNPDMKTQKNPWNQKMQKHCLTLAKDYEKLAADAEKMAEYHTARAKEMAGQ